MRATSPRPCGDPSTRSSDSLPQDDRKRAIRFARSSNSLAQNDMKEANHVARDDTRESFFRRLEVTDGVGTALGAGALHVLTFHRFFFVLVSAHHATEWGHGRGRHRLSPPFLQFSAVIFPLEKSRPRIENDEGLFHALASFVGAGFFLAGRAFFFFGLRASRACAISSGVTNARRSSICPMTLANF